MTGRRCLDVNVIGSDASCSPAGSVVLLDWRLLGREE